MTEISARTAISQATYIGPGVWAPPVAGAMLYPLLLQGFSLSIQAYQANGIVASKIALATCAIVLMGLAVAVLCAALRALIGIRNSTEPNAPLVRRVLHITFATPPLYVFTGLIGWMGWAWWVGWAIIAIIALFLVRGGSVGGHASSHQSTMRTRSIHGFAALFLLLGFLVLHLGNHLVALWTVQAHHEVAKFLRAWYRSAWVEPLILALFGAMIVTGVLLIIRHTRTAGDKFRTLQTASGGYFVAFLASHLLAVLGARSYNVETNWNFAAGGPAGLLGPSAPVALIPYYALSVFLVVTHAALGLRIVLLGHDVKAITANRVVYAVTAIGALVAALITAALLGLHLGT